MAGTLTLMLTDVENSTGLHHAIGDERALEVIERCHELARAEIARHGGEEIKSLGDGLLVAFRSARQAVRAGLAVQAAVEEARRGDAAWPALRVGLNSGDVAARSDDVLGAAVSACARITPLATAGQVLMSDVTMQLCGLMEGVRFVDRGAERLRGFDRMVRLWEALPAGAAQEEAPRVRPIRVLIVDDESMVRRGFRYMLEAEPGIRVVGEASDGDEAAPAVRRLEPDVVLMDIRMKRMNGLAATRAVLAEADGRVRVIVLTTFDADEYVYDALKAGASGFLLKDSSPEQLAAGVRAVAGGEAMIEPSVTRRLIDRFAETSPAQEPSDPRLAALTAREEEVLRLIARGRSNQEIANELYLTEATIKTHVTRLLAKLEVRDRVQAVILAYESGLISPGREQGG